MPSGLAVRAGSAGSWALLVFDRQSCIFIAAIGLFVANGVHIS
jgi:hypothetical protein